MAIVVNLWAHGQELLQRRSDKRLSEILKNKVKGKNMSKEENKVLSTVSDRWKVPKKCKPVLVLTVILLLFCH